MTSLSFIQPTFDPSARKLWFDGVVGVVNRYFISVYCRSFASVRFFLLDVVQPIPFAEAFQLGTKGKNWNVHQVEAARCGGSPRCSDCRLIIAFAHIGTLFKSWVVSHNNCSNLSTKAKINYVSSRFVEVVIDLILATIRKPCFLFRQACNTLFIFVANQLCASFMKPLVLRLKPNHPQ